MLRELSPSHTCSLQTLIRAIALDSVAESMDTMLLSVQIQ